MIWTTDALLNCDGARLFPARRSIVAEVCICAREHLKGTRHEFVRWTVSKLPDAKRLSKTLPRRDIVPLAQRSISDRVQIHGRLVVVRAEGALGNAEGRFP